ncbi:hypothetical protein F5I97DRAFT_1937350 [Phlebopus sp. FC_14]|nr:hypothetical protein F5I97DRAFT_1937350 [Phlebopus sp. FC_14]
MQENQALLSTSLEANISLQSHPTARDKAVANCQFRTGTIVLTVSSLANVLLPTEKGRRCDFCLSLAVHTETRLQRCSGCAGYWYCGPKCQSSHWRTHKKYCKNFNQYCASQKFDRLEHHEKLDAILLTHLLAECSARDAEKRDKADLSIFMSLLPGPATGGFCPPTCPLATSQRPVEAVEDLFSRYGNNNFSIHSHLTTIAHGIFPLASRLFNHSCVPNAVAKYSIVQGEQVCMSIVALCDITIGEEICLPYVDPALLETRQKMFQLTHGFTCDCPSCTALGKIHVSGHASEAEEVFPSLCTSLRQYAFPSFTPENPVIELPEEPVDLTLVPAPLFSLLRESYLSRLCESFSSLSHDGPFESALDSGLTVLAFYTLIYPPNYPQIGMHLLEMAKTAWNAIVTFERTTSSTSTAETGLLRQGRAYLRLSSRILDVVGPEGDPGGPLAEVQLLDRLLHDQQE